MSTKDHPTDTEGPSSPPGTEPLLDEARHAVDNVAAEASKVAEQVAALAGAIGKAAAELDHSDQKLFAGYARDVAGALETLSSAIRERGVDELMDSLRQFARSQPAAFLGAAALAGFAASRFAKASAHRPDKGALDLAGESSMVASSTSYPDGDSSQTGQFGQGLGSSGDAAAWRSTGNYPQTERGH